MQLIHYYATGSFWVVDYIEKLLKEKMFTPSQDDLGLLVMGFYSKYCSKNFL